MQVGQSRAKLVTTRVDFGLVRLSGSAQQPLVIRNSSATCSTPWSVRELTQSVIAAVGGWAGGWLWEWWGRRAGEGAGADEQGGVAAPGFRV